MSLKKNTIANYVGQIYVITVAVVVTPLYLQYLGAEAYGLVGFFALMQAWMNLLDLGLSPTLGRQAAHARGQERGFENFKRLLKSFEMIFAVLALFSIATVYVLSDWIAGYWFKAKDLDITTLSYCVTLMGAMVGFRWFAGLYRSGINGLEDQVWLNAANMFLITLKFLGALLLLAYLSQDVRHFFEYQLVIGLIEVMIFAWRFYAKLPTTQLTPNFFAFDWRLVKSVAPFALSIAYTAGIWVLITQTDKLVLSGVLTLAEFGYFSLIALIAGGVTMVSGAISQALIPRLTLLFSQGEKQKMLVLYRQASQIVTVTSLSVALVVGFYAEPLVLAWTGDSIAAKWGSEILIWFALGNGVLAIGAFQYYIQNAFGQLKLHVIGSTLSALIQVPLIYYAAVKYGAYGVSIVWCAFRIIWFLWWTPIVHYRLIPGFHVNWMVKDILPICVITCISAVVIEHLFVLDLAQNKLLLLFKIAVLGMLLISISGISSNFIRNYAINKLKAKS